MLNRRGQTILEFTVITIVIIGALIATQGYLKNGFQGRWKSTADDFGDQYDPRFVNSNIVYGTQTNSTSVVSVQNGEDSAGDVGQWTNRLDTSQSAETKSGSTQVGD